MEALENNTNHAMGQITSALEIGAMKPISQLVTTDAQNTNVHIVFNAFHPLASQAQIASTIQVEPIKSLHKQKGNSKQPPPKMGWTEEEVTNALMKSFQKADQQPTKNLATDQRGSEPSSRGSLNGISMPSTVPDVQTSLSVPSSTGAVSVVYNAPPANAIISAGPDFPQMRTEQYTHSSFLHTAATDLIPRLDQTRVVQNQMHEQNGMHSVPPAPKVQQPNTLPQGRSVARSQDAHALASRAALLISASAPATQPIPLQMYQQYYQEKQQLGSDEASAGKNLPLHLRSAFARVQFSLSDDVSSNNQPSAIDCSAPPQTAVGNQSENVHFHSYVTENVPASQQHTYSLTFQQQQALHQSYMQPSNNAQRHQQQNQQQQQKASLQSYHVPQHEQQQAIQYQIHDHHREYSYQEASLQKKLQTEQRRAQLVQQARYQEMAQQQQQQQQQQVHVQQIQQSLGWQHWQQITTHEGSENQGSHPPNYFGDYNRSCPTALHPAGPAPLSYLSSEPAHAREMQREHAPRQGGHKPHDELPQMHEQAHRDSYSGSSHRPHFSSNHPQNNRGANGHNWHLNADSSLPSLAPLVPHHSPVMPSPERMPNAPQALNSQQYTLAPTIDDPSMSAQHSLQKPVDMVADSDVPPSLVPDPSMLATLASLSPASLTSVLALVRSLLAKHAMEGNTAHVDQHMIPEYQSGRNPPLHPGPPSGPSPQSRDPGHAWAPLQPSSSLSYPPELHSESHHAGLEAPGGNIPDYSLLEGLLQEIGSESSFPDRQAVGPKLSSLLSSLLPSPEEIAALPLGRTSLDRSLSGQEAALLGIAGTISGSQGLGPSFTSLLSNLLSNPELVASLPQRTRELSGGMPAGLHALGGGSLTAALEAQDYFQHQPSTPMEMDPYNDGSYL